MKNVAGYIERKSMLYKTDVEYGDYTMNHVQGCAHGCNYPYYAYLMAKRFGKIKTYEEWLQPYLVKNTLELLDDEIPKLKNKIQMVQLCFTTDPFMHEYDEIKKMSLASIQKLNEALIPCSILTKGILPQKLVKYSKENLYGITLVSLSKKFHDEYEPYSADIKSRIKALKYLHENGCKTWVSMEPYPSPNIIEQDIVEILDKISFVDKIVFGRTNYNSLISSYKKHKEFYNTQAQIVIDFCENHKIKYHIKKGTIRN